MAANPALTNSETSALEGPSTLLRYLSPVPDTDVATARINQSVFSYPLAQLTVDSTSGWSAVSAGDTVYVGTTAGASDIGIYRVRLTPGSTTLYIGETSGQDAGQLPTDIRTAGFADNQYITVKQRFDIWSVLPVINASTGATYEDYSLSVSTYNTTPPPLVNVTVNGRRNHLATLIADAETFALTAIAAPQSWPTSTGETFTYLWTTPASGWSSVSGATTTTLTADVDPGNYVVYLTVTGSLSGATQRAVIVHIHDESTNPPLLISEMPKSDLRDRTGRRMSFDLYSNRLASIPMGAACIYFEVATWSNQWMDSEGVLDGAIDDSETDIDVDDGSLFAEGDILLIGSEQLLVVSIAADTLAVTRAYNGTRAAAHADGDTIYIYAPSTDVPTATRQMFGWLQRVDKSAEAGLRQASIELVSPSFRLAELNSTSQIVTAVSSPATWQQVKPALSTATFMAWYILRWRAANVLLLFNFTSFSVAAAGQRLPSWTIDKGTILQQLQSLATERGNFGCDSEGEFYFLRHPSYVNYDDRGSIVVRDSVDASIYTSANNPRVLTNRAQQVRGEGFSWDGSAALPTPYYSDAPKSPGQGSGQIKLASQVVTGQDELDQLTGDHYQHANNPYPVVDYKILRNRDVIEPAQMAFVQFSIPAYLSADGTAWENKRLIPLTVSKSHNPDGTSDLIVTSERETHNIKGSLVPVPQGNDSIYTPAYTPIALDPLPPLSLGDFASIPTPASVPSPQGAPVSPGKGAIWVNAAGTAIKRTLDISVEPPIVTDVTPSDAFFTDFKMVIHDKSDNFSRGAYALGNDGVNSKIAHTTDIYADTVVWTVGGTLTGIYTALESAGMSSLAGGVVAYSSAGGDEESWTHIIDFTADDAGFAPSGGVWAGAYGSYSPGVGWLSTNASPDGLLRRAINIERMLPWANYTYAKVIYDYTRGTWALPGAGAVGVLIGAANDTLFITNDPLTNGTGRESAGTGNRTGDSVQVFLTDSTGHSDGDGTITGLELGGSGPNPFEPVSVVATSDDYGATFTVQSPSAGGGKAFCLSRFGTVAMAAADDALEKASSWGGAFSSVTGGGTSGTYPMAARIPWFKIGKKSLTNNGTSPDFYLAAAALVSGESLWKVIAGTRTAVTPSVSGTKALAPTANSIGTYSANRICFIGDISGTRRIFTSSNSGTTWVYSTVSGATSVRAQRFSPSGLIWIAATSSNVRYSNDGGVTWSNRTVSGGALYAELMG